MDLLHAIQDQVRQGRLCLCNCFQGTQEIADSRVAWGPGHTAYPYCSGVRPEHRLPMNPAFPHNGRNGALSRTANL